MLGCVACRRNHTRPASASNGRDDKVVDQNRWRRQKGGTLEIIKKAAGILARKHQTKASVHEQRKVLLQNSGLKLAIGK
jgi:hypothetical protein